mgnify:CR=1 FL=1
MNGLSEKLSAIKQEILDGMESLDSSKAVYEFKKTFLDSKTGKIGQLMKGMNTSLTREVVILPKAVAMITPTAMSITLPRAINSLNSLIIFM